MSIWVTLFYGVLQGATELFPVSSLGHAEVVPQLLHLGIQPNSPALLPFLTLLHLGTAAALLFVYRREWLQISRGFVHGAISGDVSGPNERLAVLVVVGTVPAGFIGFLLKDVLKPVFASPRSAAGFLVVNGVLLLGAEFLRRRDERRRGVTHLMAETREYAGLEQLSIRAALLIGASQALALLPGISRSGVTIATGLLAQLRHEEALRFALLLATPLILAAGLLEVPELGGSPQLGLYLAGGVVAAITAFLTAKFLARYFVVGRLTPYALYCVVLGVVSLIFL